MWDEFGHNSGRLFPLSILNQENPDTQEDYPSKGEGTPAIREMKVEQKGRELMDGKMFSNFLVVVSREALCLTFMSYKHTCNTPNAKMAAGLIFFCLN